MSTQIIPPWILVRDMCIAVSWLLFALKNSNLHAIEGKTRSDITRNVPRPRAPLHFISKARERETAGLDG